MLEYKLVEKSEFTVIGKCRKFDMETSYNEIPKFWDEHMKSSDSKVVNGKYGVCMDCGDKDFNYLIADDYMPGKDIPQGFETKVFPKGTWAVFSCKGVKNLQDVNTKIWSEWLPSCTSYKLGGNYNIEMYTNSDYCEIWMPIEKL